MILNTVAIYDAFHAEFDKLAGEPEQYRELKRKYAGAESDVLGDVLGDVLDDLSLTSAIFVERGFIVGFNAAMQLILSSL